MSAVTPKAVPSAADRRRVVVAAEWFTRLREDPVSAEDLAAWLAWYEEDEGNKRAFESVRTMWEQADRLPAAAPLAANAGWRRRRYRLAAAAAAAVVVMLGAIAWKLTPATLPEAAPLPVVVEGPQAFVAEAGPAASLNAPAAARPVQALVKEAYLPDGSRVSLAEKSAVAVKFTAARRELVMQRGVAYFTVAHNSERPFMVKVGNIVVRAVGTAFNVRNSGDRVVVTVTEGKVKLYPAAADVGSAAPENSVQVEAGREAVWSVQNELPTVSAVDTSHALAWQRGILDYVNEPLGSAIEDINRYSSRKILIRDTAVENIVFSGTVFVDATDAWVRALPKLFPLEVVVDEQGNYLLVARNSAG